MFRIFVKLRGCWVPTDCEATRAAHLRHAYREWCAHYGRRHVRVWPE